MDFTLTDRENHFRNRVKQFIEDQIAPLSPDYPADLNDGNRWQASKVMSSNEKRANLVSSWRTAPIEFFGYGYRFGLGAG